MFTKFDKWFEETAADPARRRAAIADYSRRRIILFWCAVLSSVCAIAIFLVPSHHPGGEGMVGFLAAMMWIVGMKVDSDLRVLKMIDKFYRRDEKPAA